MLAFATMYILLLIGGTIVVVGLGAELRRGARRVGNIAGDMGPAIGEAGADANFTDGFSRPARMVLAWLMLVGRLEILPLLFVFAPLRRRARRIVTAP